jgi:outer membrane immunogenic protein
MRLLPITLVAIISALSSYGPASAADMPVKAPIASPAYNWTGFYLGVNAGYGWGRNNADFTGDGRTGAGNDFISRVFDGPLNFNPITRSQGINSAGAVGGDQVGYNWQFSPVWVAGLEADIQASGLRGSFNRPAAFVPLSLNAEQKLNWFGTVRGRLGYLVNERILLFGTAGLAYGETEASANFASNNGFFAVGATAINCVAGPACLGGRSTNTSAGWTAGAGAEWAATNTVSLKLEYLHIALPDSTVVMTAIAPATGNATVTANFRNQFDIVRAGANWRF